MDNLFNRYWWLFLIRGIFAVLLGLIALFSPETAFTGLVLFIGAYMFVDGIFSMVAAVTQRKTYRSWPLLFIGGLFGVIIGIITFINPFATGAALIYLIAVWALILGLVDIALAIRLRNQIKGEGWFILAGILTIAFSIMILLNPLEGAIALTVLLGIYALLFGIMLISLAIRLKNKNNGNQQVFSRHSYSS